MQPIQGKDVVVSMLIEDNYYPIFCGTDMTFSLVQDVVLASSASTGSFRRKRLRQLSEWTVTVNGVSKIDNTDGQISFFYLLQQAVRGQEQTIQVYFTDDDGNEQAITGSIIIPDLNITGPYDSFSDASVTMVGSGEFELNEVEPPVPPTLKSDHWLTTPGENSISGASQYSQATDLENKTIIAVMREGTQFNYTNGTPGNREYGYTGTAITFDSTNPFNTGETVFVIWSES